MTDKLLTEHNLEFLSSKGSTGSPESTLVKMPHCWKPHFYKGNLIWSYKTFWTWQSEHLRLSQQQAFNSTLTSLNDISKRNLNLFMFLTITIHMNLIMKKACIQSMRLEMRQTYLLSCSYFLEPCQRGYTPRVRIKKVLSERGPILTTFFSFFLFFN